MYTYELYYNCKKKNGSTLGRQPQRTCAGDEGTYTADLVRAALPVYPFLRKKARESARADTEVLFVIHDTV